MTVQDALQKTGTAMDDRLRASDADRDRAAAQLHVHFAAGRLTPGELDDRLTAALAARTFGDLRRALADLPGPAPGLQQAGRLECGYRRLLVLYPARYRRVHEEEMLAVLLTAAAEGKRRPGLAEAADLIAGALRVWCQRSRGGVVGWRGVLALASASAALGLLAGLAFAALNPPLPTSYAGVRFYAPLAREIDPRIQLGLANTHLVLERAAQAVRPAMPVQALQSEVQVSHTCWGQDPPPPARCNQVEISAQATRPAQADRIARAVAHSYIAYTLPTWAAMTRWRYGRPRPSPERRCSLTRSKRAGSALCAAP